jgi:spermidine/putrescine transport system permease protein
MTATATTPAPAPGVTAGPPSKPLGPSARYRSAWSERGRGPWRPPYVLAGVTVVYLLWSLLPVLIAVLFSFNSGRSRSVWQGFSMRWYTGDPNLSVLHDPGLRTALGHTLVLGLLTTLVAVPLGVAFALGLDRWHGRLPAAANVTVVLSFVIPEIVLGAGLLYMITQLAVPFQLGTTAQVVGLVTFQISYPVVIVRARLLTIGKQYEEAARDLGASPLQAVRRVLLPMLTPAVFASAVLVFADVIDDFVLVRYLSSDTSTETTSMKIYNTARAAPTPALNALASLMLLASFLAVLVGWLAYRRLTRGEQETTGLGAFTQL